MLKTTESKNSFPKADVRGCFCTDQGRVEHICYKYVRNSSFLNIHCIYNLANNAE